MSRMNKNFHHSIYCTNKLRSTNNFIPQQLNEDKYTKEFIKPKTMSLSLLKIIHEFIRIVTKKIKIIIVIKVIKVVVNI